MHPQDNGSDAFAVADYTAEAADKAVILNRAVEVWFEELSVELKGDEIHPRAMLFNGLWSIMRDHLLQVEPSGRGDMEVVCKKLKQLDEATRSQPAQAARRPSIFPTNLSPVTSSFSGPRMGAFLSEPQF